MARIEVRIVNAREMNGEVRLSPQLAWREGDDRVAGATGLLKGFFKTE
jgi:hypothetical protein